MRHNLTPEADMSTIAGRANLADLSVTELAQRIRSREISPVDVVESMLARIEALNPEINAVCTVAAEHALEAAREAEEQVVSGAPLGPLHGVPTGIKDVTPTRNIRTTFGSRLYADHVPSQDAEIVRRLKKAGAIVIGKTNTPEFAAGANTFNEVFGETRNPWNTELSAGGSTGGGAAGLAAGMFPIAEGTDFGGSLRVPASFCGVAGLRPTPGLIPIFPTEVPWDMLRVSGVMTRSVDDLALVMGAIAGPFSRSPVSVSSDDETQFHRIESFDLAGLRAAYVADVSGVGIDAEIDAICRLAANRLSKRVARLEEVEIDLSEGRQAFVTLRALSVLATHRSRLDRVHEMGENLAGNIRRGQSLTAADIAEAQAIQANLWTIISDFFEKHDVLLTPTVPTSPFPVKENYPASIGGRKMDTYIDWIAPTFIFSLLSVPVVSVPAGLTAAGLPVGLQVIAPRFADRTVLGVARRIEGDAGVCLPPPSGNRK